MARRGERLPAIQAALDAGLRGGDACVLMPKPFNGKGYKTIKFGETQINAHRVVWLMAGREIPEGLTVDHACHDPSTCPGGVTCPHRACVNLDHLRLATPAEQTANSAARNRDLCRNGKHPWTAGMGRCQECRNENRRRGRRTTLTEAQVLEIRARAAAGESHVDIARDYDVTRSNVWQVVHRNIWKHI